MTDLLFSISNRAIRGQMNGENGRKMDIVLKMMEARRLAAKIR